MRVHHTIANLGKLILLYGVLCSCQNKQDADFFSKIIVERDSLLNMTRIQNERLDAIGNLMTTINSAVDSICELEEVLFINANKDGRFSRQSALDDLTRYELLLKRQQDKLNESRIRFGDSPENEGILKVMTLQLEAKDGLIRNLKFQLAQKNVDISRLRNTIATQNTTIVRQKDTIKNLNKENEMQKKALIFQDEVINQCYVVISTKKNLEASGIIRKGKIKSDGALNNAAFMKVDIRKAKEFAFQAKKPKILSNMPQSSYMLINNGSNDYTLKITDATQFWGITNYLVIQTE